MSSFVFDESESENKHPPIIEEVDKDGKHVRFIWHNGDHEGTLIPEYVPEGDNILKPLPYIEENQRQAVYISGPSGAGKSTQAADMVEKLEKRYPEFKDCPIYFFTTNSTSDPAFKRFERSKKDQELARQMEMYPLIHVEKPPKPQRFFPMFMKDPDVQAELVKQDPAEFNTCAVIFDDWQSQPEEWKRWTMSFVNELLTHSRKNKVFIVMITHVTRQGFTTQTIIFECDTYVLFPKSNYSSVESFAKEYANLKPKQLEDFKNHKGRCIYIRKSFPTYICSDKLARLL